MTPKILIRADASLSIGSGHVMRCLSLAAALRELGAEVHFASRLLPGHLHAVIAARGYRVHALPPPDGASSRTDLAHGHWLGVAQEQDLADTRAVLEQLGGVEALVVDHYALDARWQRALRGSSRQVVVIDDLADRDHDADLLLDANLVRDGEDRYAARVPASCLQLLGPSYALLRPEFAQARAALRARRGEVSRVLVFLGGVDAGAFTERAMEALRRLRPRPRVEVIVGAGNPRAAAIAADCAASGFEFAQGVDDMAARMVAADLAIGAGGSTTWERACLGLPSLILVVADNQREGALAMRDAGCAEVLEGAEATVEAMVERLQRLRAEPEALAQMSARNLQLVDGRGAPRVARAILPPEIRLRRATAADSDDLHAWRNHEGVRRHSHSSAPIAREDHERWFAASLANAARDLLIAEHRGQPVGVLRYDCGENGVALVSIYLVPGAAGAGYGPAILRAGNRWLRETRPALARVRAEVLPENRASHKAFREAGYRWRGDAWYYELGQAGRRGA